MKEILEAIMAKLKMQVSDLQYIAEDYGQIDNYSGESPVKFPCALISISQMNFDKMPKDKQRAKIDVLVRIADAPGLTGNTTTPEEYQTRTFAIFDVLDAVGSALHDIKGEKFRNLEEQSITKHNRNDLIREYVVTFSTVFVITEN